MDAVILSFEDNLRAYYDHEGDILCLSDDGKEPAELALQPQAKKCVVCPQNVWGSRITPKGKRARACSEFAYIKVLSVDDTRKHYLRVPSTSLRSIRGYEQNLTDRGCSLEEVVTQISTDPTVDHALLSFKVSRFLNEGELENLIKLSKIEVSRFKPTDGYIH